MDRIFKNILVPVDGSSSSKISQEMAIFFSKLFGSEVTVLHLVSHELMTPGTLAFSQEGEKYRKDYTPISTSTGQFPRAVKLPQTMENRFPKEVVSEVTQWYFDRGKKIVSDAVALFKEEGISVEEKLLEGANPAEIIVSEAEKHDLVVMGNSGGEENEEDLHLGSNAKKVSATSKNPVLIVRKKKKVSNILVPIDGTAREHKAFEYASRIAKLANAKVTLLHVQEQHILKLRPEIEAFGTQILKNAANTIGVSTEQKLVSGDPAKAIIQTAEQEDTDLIIITSGGSGSFRHILLGSVSDHVLSHATVPVLLVK
jgi:nucleotide-binding universal stress UspA family protein